MVCIKKEYPERTLSKSKKSWTKAKIFALWIWDGTPVWWTLLFFTFPVLDHICGCLLFPHTSLSYCSLFLSLCCYLYFALLFYPADAGGFFKIEIKQTFFYCIFFVWWVSEPDINNFELFLLTIALVSTFLLNTDPDIDNFGFFLLITIVFALASTSLQRAR